MFGIIIQRRLNFVPAGDLNPAEIGIMQILLFNIGFAFVRTDFHNVAVGKIH